jgi:aspartyl-tRNA synthetase
MLRTHTCGELRESHAGAAVGLCGWVASVRDHKGIVFLDLRDRYGVTQVFVPSGAGDLAARALALGPETVVRVEGKVGLRPAGMRNAKRDTGAVEVEATGIEVLNPARPPAIPVNDEEAPAGDELRLRHRYLDLRRPSNRRILEGRHRIVSSVRRFFDAEGFVDVETPALVRWTPGGARNYVVPSRVHPGSFYALAESPQLFKQLLMVSGFDRYYQVVRCFRDEDLRIDRQPEFSQVDVEMSFVEEADVMDVVERMFAAVVRESGRGEIRLPVRRIPYAEAMLRYGCDKPDLRFGLEIADATDLARASGFGVFSGAVAKGGVVRGLSVPGGAALSRKEIDGLEKAAKDAGAAGLAWMKREAPGPEEFKGPPVKFLGAGEAAALASRVGASAGDLAVFVAAAEETACAALAAVRGAAARARGLVDAARLEPCWIVDFPLFEKTDSGGWAARHHAFTSPRPADLEFLETDPGRVHARAYDLVCNGYEIGGGSIRTHRTDVQERVFKAIGIGAGEAREKFTFLLEALASGAPPHGGIALGVDRLAMVVLGLPNIRDVIAFPKTTSAQDLMTGAPSHVADAQLRELRIRLDGA